MSDDRTFERNARAWLELGPTDAPDRVVQAALLEIESTAQERDLWIPWRITAMNRTVRLLGAVAAVAVVAVGAIALLGRPATNVGTGSPSPSAGALALTQHIAVPARYYTVDLPADWQAVLGGDAASSDSFSGPQGTLSITLGHITAGVGQEEWLSGAYQDELAKLDGTCSNDPSSRQPVRVGDRPGDLTGPGLYRLTCLPGWLVLAPVGDRGYVVLFKVANAVDLGAAREQVFRQILVSLVLEQGPNRASPAVSSAAPSPS